MVHWTVEKYDETSMAFRGSIIKVGVEKFANEQICEMLVISRILLNLVLDYLLLSVRINKLSTTLIFTIFLLKICLTNTSTFIFHNISITANELV